jgi:hypothetical protein
MAALIEQTRGCVSFSLYGEGAKYAWGAVENVALARRYYPGWECRVHVERGHYATGALRRAGAVVVEQAPVAGSRGMFWRFLPADDPSFTHVIIRDADSRINPRDAACTEEWLKSGTALHVIRDHYWHEQRAILGGAWGIRTGTLDMGGEINRWKHNNKYGDDEDFLARVVWEHLKHDCLRHSHNPVDKDRPIPQHEPYVGFVCEQIEPVFNIPHRCVYLSPEKYVRRRERFLASAASHAPFMAPMELHRGTTGQDRIIPEHFDHVGKHPHYFLATADHMDILEKSYLQGDELLFVFEDDARFLPDFREYLLRLWLALPDGWLGAMLGGQSHSDHNRRLTSPAYPNAIARVDGCLGMHATMWNRAGMLRLWNHLHYWNRQTVDWAFTGLQREEPHFYAPARWIVDIDPGAVQYGNDT